MAYAVRVRMQSAHVLEPLFERGAVWHVDRSDASAYGTVGSEGTRSQLDSVRGVKVA